MTWGEDLLLPLWATPALVMEEEYCGTDTAKYISHLLIFAILTICPMFFINTPCLPLSKLKFATVLDPIYLF